MPGRRGPGLLLGGGGQLYGAVGGRVLPELVGILQERKPANLWNKLLSVLARL